MINGSVNNTVKFNIIHQNIRSIRSNFDIFISELASRNLNPEIIALSEIWIKNNVKQFYEIPIYVSFLNTNAELRAGGVILCLESNLKSNRLCFFVISVSSYFET